MEYFVFDVESAGLNGAGFSFGYVVVDENGKEIEAGFATSGIDSVKVSKEDKDWLEKNLPQEILYPAGDYKLTRQELETAFWNIFQKHKNAEKVCDCGYPVEARWLLDCGCTAYPLHELATALLLNEKDPLGNYARRDNEKPKHHPLADARQSARLWIECLKRGDNR